MTQATILVVEDEGIVAQEIKSRLEKSGYTVCAVAHDGRLLSDGRRQVAGFHGSHGIVDGVETDENDLGVAAGGLGRLDGTQDHLVVVGEHAGDLRFSLEDILKDAQALGSIEVGRLASDDFGPSAVGAHVVIETLAPVASGRGAGDAFQLDDVTRAADGVT